MPAFDPVHDALASNDQQLHEQQQYEQQHQSPLQPEIKQEIDASKIPINTSARHGPISILNDDDDTPNHQSFPPITASHDIKPSSIPLTHSSNLPPLTPVQQPYSASHIAADGDPSATSTPSSPSESRVGSISSTSSGSGSTSSKTTAKGDSKVQTELGEHITISTPGKPTIIKHKLNTHFRSNGKRIKKSAVTPKPPPAAPPISVRSRHLKKDDGQPFWRRDIQYALLNSLFENDVKAFSDPFPESKENVNIDSRKPDVDGKLSFAELYIKSIAQSGKCSKVLRDRLLNDMKMSIPTSMICLLVNVGRMNTTINFVPDMKSQLRTYHSIPALQVNYDTGSTIDKNDKQLQDTPRLKSILKACCDDPGEPNGLHSLALSTKFPKTNAINMIFILCNIEDAINKKFFKDLDYTFFDIFMTPKYPPGERAHLFLWILYNYLETQLDEEGIMNNPFGPKPILVPGNPDDYDNDTPEELEFGRALLEQRVKFLATDEPIPRRYETKSTPSKVKANSKSPGTTDHHENDDKSEGSDDEKPHPLQIKLEAIDESVARMPAEIELLKQPPTKESKTPQKSASHKTSTPASKLSGNASSTPSVAPVSTPVVPPPTPVLRQDINVHKIRRILKNQRRINHKKRTRAGLLIHEYRTIGKENTPDLGKEFNNRLRLKNYTGDYVEYTTKFRTLFNLLKGDYAELNKAVMDEEKPVVQEQYEDAESLKLKSFDIIL